MQPTPEVDTREIHSEVTVAFAFASLASFVTIVEGELEHFDFLI